ncbi:MAG: hypothetical protein JWN82_149 [Candidatus Saccharibacteria bacterium]|nr:hypothetical protein [Candidatus Saccharibacteria bacterium]
MKLLPKILPRTAEERRAEAYRRFLRRQAKMGGTLFGPVPDGHRREFFCLDKHTWVWHEEWVDAAGQTQAMTTRYDVGAQGILKSQGNSSYQRVTGAELKNFYQATRLYRDNVHQQYAIMQR